MPAVTFQIRSGNENNVDENQMVESKMGVAPWRIDAVNYFLADQLGSTIGLMDSTGSLMASNQYDSFGNPTNTTFPSRYQFTGREYDKFNGLYYYRARMYDPALGRFISEDPIGFEGGDVNLYGYVHNNPINKKDPFGLIDRGWGSPTGPAIPYSWNNNQPDPARAEAIAACYRKWKFSSVFSFGNPTAESVLEFIEIGSLASITLDSVAIARKASGPSTASSNVYASGINMLAKDASRLTGYPGVFRFARPIGDKATPILAITGAGTFAYNVTTEIQCACGIID